MTIKNEIYELLKKEKLTVDDIIKKKGYKKGTVNTYISQLKSDGKIDQVGNKGKIIIYSAIPEKITSENSIIQADPFDLINNPKFIDSLLFSFISSCNKATYSKLKSFFASLGILDKNLIFSLIRNLEKELLKTINVPNDNYSLLLNFFTHNRKELELKYPLILNFQEAFSFFKPLGIQNVNELISFFVNLSEKYSGFISLSSSRSAYPSDLITIKQIFLDQIEFTLSGAWSVN